MRGWAAARPPGCARLDDPPAPRLALPPVTTFAPDIVAAILHHMNDDHRDDNLLIARAFVNPEASASTMIDLDGDGGLWEVTLPGGAVSRASVAWPSGAITERPEVRREIVALYDGACAALGIEPRPHA